MKKIWAHAILLVSMLTKETQGFPLRKVLLASNNIGSDILWNSLRELQIGTADTVKLVYIPTASMFLDPSSNSTRSVGQRKARLRSSMMKKMKTVAASLSTSGKAVLPSYFDISDPGITSESILPILRDSQCIYVEGGNTFYLAHHLRRTLFEEALRKLDTPFIYMGISAGAICAGASISPALWKGWDKTIPEIDTSNESMLHGMNLQGGVSFFPHYSSTWDETVKNKAGSLGHTCVLLRDDVSISLPAPATPSISMLECLQTADIWTSNLI